MTIGARITGVGRYVPERILTNADLEKIVETSDEWITTRTGIRERHIAGDGETTASMGALAAARALAVAGVSADSVDLIVVATLTPALAGLRWLLRIDWERRCPEGSAGAGIHASAAEWEKESPGRPCWACLPN